MLLLESATTAPVGGAEPVSVTVPVELLPPITELGVRVTDERVAAVTVRVAVALALKVAVMTEVVLDATPRLVTINVLELLPAGTVMLAGTVAAIVLLLLSDTTAPPVGATPFSLTVAVELLPPTTLVGLNETEDMRMGFTVNVAIAFAP